MSDNQKFQHKYRIPSARYALHDYNGGLYFITICTKGMEHFFGEIHEGEMLLNELGKYVAECIENIPKHFPNAEVPLCVIMPNHIHLIIAIDEVTNCASVSSRDVIYGVSNTETTINENAIDSDRQRGNETNNNGDAIYDVSTNEKMQSIAMKCGQLSRVISNFKSAITRYVNQNNLPFAWQTRFYDRVIHNQEECNRIADYIENNPMNWENDKCNG